MNKIDEMLKPFPREHISLLPTPFHRLNTLSEILDRNIYIKRDDLTGFAFGGNKTRKFDFLVADAKDKGCDTIIGMGANQSNFCRILSCVGSKYGFTVHLVLTGKKPEKPTGNLLIDYMAGAKIHHIETEDPDFRMEEAIKLNDKLKAQGKNVYFLPPGGSIPIGVLGYAAGFSEFLDDFRSSNIKIDKIFHASSSAGTQAGLVLGQSISNWNGQVIGISVDELKVDLEKNVSDLANKAAGLINTNIKRSIVYVDDSYIGEGYGKRTSQCEEAVNLFAKSEGIFLDYVYTGKAAAGLIDYCQTGKIKQNENIVFLHTGGNIEIFE
jgi:D-cysteine desulfhydrase family pyridoxal phosphate-dependent enzyme